MTEPGGSSGVPGPALLAGVLSGVPGPALLAGVLSGVPGPALLAGVLSGLKPASPTQFELCSNGSPQRTKGQN